MDRTSLTQLQAPARLLYSRQEAAYMLSTSLRNIAYRIAQGTLEIRRQGGRVLITHAELLRQAALDDNEPIVPQRSPSKSPLTVTSINRDDFQVAS
jgi:hypothetical protein